MSLFCRWWKRDLEELRECAEDSRKRADEAEHQRTRAIRALNETRRTNKELHKHLVQNGWSELLQEAMRGAR